MNDKTKQRLCTALMITYHALFGSSMYIVGEDYINELKALRTEIRQQSEAITKMLSKAEVSLDKAGQVCKDLSKKNPFRR